MSVVGRVYLERGEPVTVLIAWAGPGPRNVLIRRASGEKVVRPFRGLRRRRLAPVMEALF
jgi:acetyl esterase